MKNIIILFAMLVMACIAQAQSKDTMVLKPTFKAIKYNNQVYAVDSTGIHEPKQEGIFVLKLDAQTIQAIYGALDKSTENHQLIKALQEYLAAEVKRQQ